MKAAVLFDLDDTLVDSDNLRAYRDNERWSELSPDVLASVKLFNGVADLLTSLKYLDCGIAIVTTSPKWYAEALIKLLAIPCDALVAAKDVEWGKPQKDPSELALKLMGHNNSATAFVVGDRCIDIASGEPVCDWTIGATWAAKNQRELILSYPKVLANSPSEVFQVVSNVLAGTPPEKHAWCNTVDAEMWLESPSWDIRPHLSGAGINYKFVRVYRGKGSWGDKQIWNFKSKNPKQWWFKDQAAKSFARELEQAIPKGSWILFVLPSALKGTDGYDNRWELIESHLSEEAQKRGWTFCQAIVPTESATPAHEQEADSLDRDPDVIGSRLNWVGGIPSDASDVVIIDDVLTKGGHMRAYHDLVRQHLPATEIHILSWAVFSSQPWHSCPSANM